MINNHNNQICERIKNLIRPSLMGLLMLNIFNYAWANDLPDKIFITADHMKMNIETGDSMYTGHVNETGETIEAESEHMVYTASKNTLVMTTNAHLKQPDHQLSSQKIVYNTEKKIVMAGSDKNTPGIDSQPTGNQRVNITLTPQEATTE